jgi:hypothetical protein
MKKRFTMLFAVMAGVAIGLLVVRRINTRQMLVQVSEEGYETAHDILYPRHNKRGKKVKYGPVLPE